MVLGLHGTNPGEINLMGTFQKNTDEMSKKLVDKLLIPLTQQKWNIVNENYILLNSRMRNYFADNDVFLHFLKSLEIILKHKPSEKENSLVFVLPPIQLKPEYEIYKLLFGIPEEYDKGRLNHIRKLLKKENITFEKIKNSILIQ